MSFGIMRSKFVEPPSWQAASQRPPPPPANVLTEEAMAKAILSFHKGAGGGPMGVRPDFLRQIIGEKRDKPGLSLITRFCSLLADGQAPDGVRPFIAGANGFAFEKEIKAGAARQDA